MCQALGRSQCVQQGKSPAFLQLLLVSICVSIYKTLYVASNFHMKGTESGALCFISQLCIFRVLSC